MKLARTLLMGVAAASLAATPAMAAPAARAAQPTDEISELGGGTGLIFIAAAIAVVILAIVAFNNDVDDEAVSP